MSYRAQISSLYRTRYVSVEFTPLSLVIDRRDLGPILIFTSYKITFPQLFSLGTGAHEMVYVVSFTLEDTALSGPTLGASE